jgi:hypothetical protein
VHSNNLTADMPACPIAVRCGSATPLPPSPPPEPIFEEPLAPPYDPMNDLPCDYTLDKGGLLEQCAAHSAVQWVDAVVVSGLCDHELALVALRHWPAAAVAQGTGMCGHQITKSIPPLLPACLQSPW